MKIFRWLAIIYTACIPMSAMAISELFPSGLEGINELYTARGVTLSWKSFVNSEDQHENRRELSVGNLYTISEKITLVKPLDYEAKPRSDGDSHLVAEPLGNFIAFALDGTAWLITVERNNYFITITSLKNAVDQDDPDFSKLYWPNLEEPQFKLQSRFLYSLIKLQ